ncbi:MAG: alkaline phosphatase family protein [Gemmatimonadota bacterium]|nr:alkaline phosphatase family protein [Gemmatimonadota bacterium]
MRTVTLPVPRAALAALLALSAACGQTTNKVLLIGIDGVRPDVLAEVPTPNIDRLIEAGAFSTRGNTTRPTISGPAWSSMLIGVWPDKHGVWSNDFAGNRYSEYPDFLTRLERIRPQVETFVAADWLPLVTDDSGGPLFTAEIDRIVVHDGYTAGWAEADELGVRAAAAALRDADPDAVFVYLGNPDEMSHQAWSIGRRYREAIALSDAHVGQLVDAVTGRSSYADEDWLILISTDHGRLATGQHGGEAPEETTIFVLAHGPSVLPGTIAGTPQIVDVAVTALAHMGVKIDAAWGLDGRPVALRRTRRRGR